MKLRGGSNKLSKLYYSTNGYWKGYAAISKLAHTAKVSEAEVKQWLEKQALWQIYLPAPKYILRPHWTLNKPNKIHQANLLFLPHDTYRKKTYKYALVVVDIASTYKDAEALTTKKSSEVAKAFEKIYSRKLKWPEILMVDPGKEFFGNVTTLMNKHKVNFQRSEAGNHRAQAFVERANRTLDEKIFTHQYAQEMADAQKSKNRSRDWVERLPAVLKVMNNEVTRLTGKEPASSIKLKEVPTQDVTYNRPVSLNEKRLSPFAQVRHLLVPGEEEGDERRRATDPIWSLGVNDLSRSVLSPGQPVLYYLSEGPKRSFVREEFQIVPSDTELPPKHV